MWRVTSVSGPKCSFSARSMTEACSWAASREKYTAPTATGLIINEFESNPAGSDKNNEWIELLNNTSQAIDLAGYTLIASSDRSTKKMVLSGTIAPGEFLVIKPTFSMVNNSGKLTKNGEGLTLKDPERTLCPYL